MGLTVTDHASVHVYIVTKSKYLWPQARMSAWRRGASKDHKEGVGDPLVQVTANLGSRPGWTHGSSVLGLLDSSGECLVIL